jgi:hypothetical protein
MGALNNIIIIESRMILLIRSKNKGMLIFTNAAQNVGTARRLSFIFAKPAPFNTSYDAARDRRVRSDHCRGAAEPTRRELAV